MSRMGTEKTGEGLSKMLVFASMSLLATAALPSLSSAGPDRAAELLRQGQPEEARSLIASCTSHSEESRTDDVLRLLSWRLLLGVAASFMERGELESARTVIIEAGECGGAGELRLELAKSLATGGEMASALEILPEAEALPARSRPEALALRAAILEEMGIREAAREAHSVLLFEFPAHPSSRESYGRLLDLSMPGDRMPEAEAWVERLGRLADANANSEAIEAAERLLPLLPEGGRHWCRALFLLGEAHRKARNYREAIDTLSVLTETCEDEELLREGTWLLASATWILEGDPAIEIFSTFADRWPEDPKAERAFYFIAALHHREGRLDDARSVLRALLERWPEGQQSRAALWRLFWLDWIEDRPMEAMPILDRLAELGELPGGRFHLERATYWKARVLARAGRSDEAIPLLSGLVVDHPLSYYWVLAASLLADLEPDLAGELKRSLPRPEGESSEIELLSLVADPRVVAGQMLLDAGMKSDAAVLFGMASDSAREAGVVPLTTLARLLHLAGDAHSSHWLIRTGATGFDEEWPAGEAAGPWRAAYPLAWHEEVRVAAEEAGIDPLLLHAIIREESALIPTAVSWAGAVGLAQMMPRTAADVAGVLGIEVGPGREWLMDPRTNLRIAARRLSDLKAIFGGHPVLAIAAYNAGERTVMGWVTENEGAGLDEFVESIRIAETQRYTRRVLRSWATYSWLYAGDEEAEFSIPPTVRAGRLH